MSSDDNSAEAPRIPVRAKEAEFTPPTTSKTYLLRSELFRDEESGSVYSVSVQVKLKKEKSSNEAPETKKRKTNNYELDKDEVGYFYGTLIERPNRDFHGEADAISSELQELACRFCDHNGAAGRLNNDALTKKAKRGGGFFHIYKVEVRRSHQGFDLGLQMMHEALVMLDEKWTLAVLKTEVLENMCRWDENRRLPDGITGDAKSKHVDEACEKIKRYWSRMGFVQSGQTSSLHSSYFLCRDSYFKNGTKKSIPWKSKEEALQLVIFTPQRRAELTGLDQQLKQLVENAASDGMSGLLMGQSMPSAMPSQASTLSQIRDLVHQGASIAKSTVLHIASANGKMEVLGTLLTLLNPNGDDVNAKDHAGNTALHVAAATNQAQAVQYLMEFGAQKMSTNEEGETPLQSVLNVEQSLVDFKRAMGGIPMGMTFPASSVKGKEEADRQKIKSLIR